MTENALDLFYRHSFIDGHSGESTTEFVRMYLVHSNALADCSESDFNSLIVNLLLGLDSETKSAGFVSARVSRYCCRWILALALK